MFRRTQINTCALLALGGALMMPFSPALAQDAQRVEITGSRIKRVDAETANPVQVITRKEIERTGAATVNEVLQQIAGAGAGLDDRFTNGFAPGGGSVNLRGLGFNSTLVLVNGRRMPTYPFAQQVGTPQGFQDLNNIPLAAVDRVEVLKDGASAIYGADAVAGVINLILRQDYRGLEAEASYGVSQEKDGNNPQFSLTFGSGDQSKDRYNFLVGLNVSKRDAIKSKDRPFGGTEDLRPRGGNDRRSAYGTPGTILSYDDAGDIDDIFYNVGGQCGPSTQRGGSSIRGIFCRYDRAPFGEVIPESTKTGVYARGGFSLSPNHSLFAEALLTRNQFRSTGWPAGTTDDVGIGSYLIPPDNPYNPFPGEFNEIYSRFSDVGNRGDDGKSDTKRLVLGVKGVIAGWDYESAVSANRVDIDTLALNNTLNSRFMCLLNPTAAASYAAGGNPLGFGTLAQIFAANPSYGTYFQTELAKCGAAFAQFGYYNFINPAANAPGVADYLRHDSKRTGRSSLDSFDIRASRELMQLAGGAMGLALGYEQRREKASDIPDIQLQTGDTLAISAAQAFGGRKVKAFYAELNAPLTKTFEANFALRRDDYSGNGDYSATSPKIGLRFQPNKLLLLRATASNAFRAPSLFETTPAQQTSFSFGIQDPVLCPTFDENNANCILDVRRVQQGNPLLQPEKSRSYTLGMVLEPTDNVSISVDAWRINRSDEIGSFADQTLVNVFANNPLVVVRDPSGVIQQINQVPVQLNKTSTYGVDVGLALRNNLPVGRLTSRIDVSYVSRYTFTTLSDDGLSQVPSEFNGTYNQPRVRATWDFALQRGAWEYSLGGYMIGHYDGLGTTETVGTTEVWNAGLKYSGFKNVELGLQVNNLFNRRPEFNDETNGSQAGYNVQLSDPVGRFYRFGLKYKFF